MKRLSLIKDLKRDAAHGSTMLFIKGVFAAQLKCGTHDLLAVESPILVEDFPDKVFQDTVFDSDSGYEDFVDAGLPNDRIEDRRCGRDDVSPVRPQLKLAHPFLNAHPLKAPIDRLKLR